MIMSATYGIEAKSADDPFLSANLEATHALTTALMPGKFLVETIPIRARLRIQTEPTNI